MKRALVSLLNSLGLYTRGQTAPALDRLMSELLWAWQQLPEEARPRFADSLLGPSLGQDLRYLTPEDWQHLRELLGRMHTETALHLSEENGAPAASQLGEWRDPILSLNRSVSRRLGEIAGKPERWQHHVYKLFAGVVSLCGDLETRPEPVWSRMWGLLREAVNLCKTYARSPQPGQNEAISSLRTLIGELARCQAPDTWRQVLVRWVGAWVSPEDLRRLARDLPEARPLDYDAHPIRLYVDSSNEAEIRAISCAKEPGTVAWIEENLQPGDVMYDIGANVGAYSLIAAKHTENRATVLAFEPSFPNFYQLCRNVLLNGCEASITPLCLPLSRETGQGLFHYHNTERGGSLHSFGRPDTDQDVEFKPIASIGAVGFGLDELAAAAGLPHPTLIKLDVDGLERDILEGASATLRLPELRSVLLELNEEQPEELARVFDLFHRADFSPLEKHPLSDRLHNYLFFRPGLLPPRPPRPEEVPVTTRRGQGFAPKLTAG